MTRLSLHRLFSLFAATALFIGSHTALAGDDDDDRPKDFDEETESRSKFWEGAIHPHSELYSNRVKRAKALINRSDRQSRDSALRLLTDSIKMQPDAPDAYWYLGVLHYRNKDYKKCAAVHSRMLKKHAKFKPEYDSRNPPSLDMSLGMCNALAGSYEAAIRHFKRILARGETGSYEVHWRLGETYMALGRLKDAIASLQTALRLRHDSLVNFALAAAYDRNEQLALARDQLKSARFGYSHRQVVPEEDRIYYKALQFQHTNKPRRALLYFREYLHAAKNSQWRRRAEHHLKTIKIAQITPAQFDLSGSAKMDLNLLATRINQAQPRFQTCLSKTPGLLVDVRLVTKQVPGTARRRGPRLYSRHGYGYSRSPYSYAPRYEPGATAVIVQQFNTTPEAAREAVQCVQTVATSLKLPPVSGTPGDWRKIVFSLVKLP